PPFDLRLLEVVLAAHIHELPLPPDQLKEELQLPLRRPPLKLLRLHRPSTWTRALYPVQSRRGTSSRLLSLTALVLRPRGPPRPSTVTASTAVLRLLVRRQTPEETSHRAPDLGLHQLTNNRDDALAARHPPPPYYRRLPYPRLDRFADAVGESTSLLTNSVPSGWVCLGWRSYSAVIRGRRDDRAWRGTTRLCGPAGD